MMNIINDLRKTIEYLIDIRTDGSVELAVKLKWSRMGRYRKRSSIVSDTVQVGSRLPWWGALLLGAILSFLFCFIMPNWLEAKLAAQSGNTFFPILESIFGRRIHWFQWIGAACGLVGLFFGVRNYLFGNTANYYERSIVGFLARMFGRDIS